MIEGLRIENFRLFRELDVSELRRVNLFVGKNNSGKSALLEAVRIFVTGAAPDLLMKLVQDREESWSHPMQTPDVFGADHPVRHLFKGHQFPEPDELGIRLIGHGDPAGVLHLTVGAFVRERLDDGTIRRVRVEPQDFFRAYDSADFDQGLVVEDESGSRWLMALDQTRRRRVGRGLHGGPKNRGVQVLPTGSLDATQIAYLWDEISLTEDETTVLEALRLLDPKIQGLALVENHSGSRPGERVPILKTSDFREPVPLSSMGDGMTRVFQLVLSMVNARGGVLIVDEFENGLHWSVQVGVWELVWRLAYSLEVQVFASTHSSDCVRAFSRIWERSNPDGAFYRLERDSRGVSEITRYHAAALTDSVASDVEMR